MPNPISDNVVTGLAHGLRAIEAFETGGRSLTLSEVAAAIALSSPVASPGSARRLQQALPALRTASRALGELL